MQNNTEAIDVKNIEESDCNLKSFPLSELRIPERPAGFQIVVRRSTLAVIQEHGRSSAYVEVGGMLVGNLYWDNGPFLLVEASIVGKHTVNSAASIKFTLESWRYFLAKQKTSYPNDLIIGWYHTHPGLGVFLSSTDLFHCNHTFYAPHQIAYVYDPKSETEGWFAWKNSVPTQVKPLIIEDVPGLPLVGNSVQAEMPIAPPILPVSSLLPHIDKSATNIERFIPMLVVLHSFLILIMGIAVICLVFSSVYQQGIPSKIERCLESQNQPPSTPKASQKENAEPKLLDEVMQRVEVSTTTTEEKPAKSLSINGH